MDILYTRIMREDIMLLQEQVIYHMTIYYTSLQLYKW